MKIQYQMSNGNWTDCENRTDEFLTRCERNNRISDGGKINNRATWETDRQMNRDEVIAALNTGITLRNSPNDWYSNCRDGEAVERIMAARRAAAPPVKMVKCACGHTIPSGSVMSTSTGTSCPDCYDRMSM